LGLTADNPWVTTGASFLTNAPFFSSLARALVHICEFLPNGRPNGREVAFPIDLSQVAEKMNGALPDLAMGLFRFSLAVVYRAIRHQTFFVDALRPPVGIRVVLAKIGGEGLNLLVHIWECLCYHVAVAVVG
jgi:hypothetical protein